MNLMTPRVKCIGSNGLHYPSSHFEPDEVLTKIDGIQYYRNSAFRIEARIVESYTHLFRPMPWYEERTAEEMPEYVKALDTESGVVRKVHGLSDGVLYFGNGMAAWARNYTPATESEYNEYIKAKG